ncbi:MAG: hypothetical protein H0W67_08415, partial [Gemmatimonadales bacterium]|nr:hypothetical protein [Gemmatimonadales bacterium]
VLVQDADLAEAMEMQFRRDIARSREVRHRLLRGPRRISQVLPAALTRSDPEIEPASHHRTRREAGRRAAVAVRVIAGNARRSVFVPVGAIFLVLGLLFAVVPKATAYTFAALCAWLALGAGREAFRRRTG